MLDVAIPRGLDNKFREVVRSIEAFGGAKLFGDSLQTPVAVWKYLPIAVAVLGYLMASRLPMPNDSKCVHVMLEVDQLDHVGRRRRRRPDPAATARQFRR